jgi:hypothetical protein
MVEPLTASAIDALDEICNRWPLIDREWLQSLARSVIHADAKPLAKMTQERIDAVEKFEWLLDAVDELSAKANDFRQLELETLALQRSNAALTVQQRLIELRAIFQECAKDLAGKSGRTAERRSILIRHVAQYLSNNGIVVNAKQGGPLETVTFTLLKLAGDDMKHSTKIVKRVLETK